MAEAIQELLAEAQDLRAKAEAQPDGRIAQVMREGADLAEAAANDAMQSVDFKAWLAAGAPQ